MRYGLYDSKIELEEKVRKRKVVDLGPIMLDAERCVLCSRCLRFEDVVTGTNSLQFVNRGDHTSISTFDGGKIEHDYAGNLADVCPVGALLSKDFRFKMRVWFLKEHESVCPGCSTGCNVYVDERDGEVQRLRARRNPDVNKSWLCDPGRALYKQIGVTERVSGARVRGAGGWAGTTVAAALDRVAEALKSAGSAAAFVATPQGTNEDVFAFKTLAEAVGGTLDFRVGDPQLKVQQKLDNVLQHVDRNPNTQGCLDQGLGKDGVDTILAACRAGSVKALVLQGPELLRRPGGRGRDREGPVRRGDGDARGSRARPLQRRAAGGDVGRGVRYLHELPAPRAAADRRPCRRRVTRSRATSWRRVSCRDSASRWAPRARARCSRSSRRPRRATRASTIAASAPRV